MPTTAETLPQTSDEWHTIAKQRGLQSESIHGEQVYRAYKSASAIEFEQFLLLRVIYYSTEHPDQVYHAQHRATWLRSDAFDAAAASLKARQEWKLYLNSILPVQQQQTTQAGLSSLGLFALVRYYQLATEKEHEEQNDLSQPKIDFSPVAGRTRSRQAASDWPSGPPETPTRSPRGEQGELEVLLQELGLDSPSESSPEPSTPEIPETLSPANPSDPDWIEAAEFKAANDEQIVNTALLLYLNALSIACSQVQGDWTLHRRQFVLKSNGKKVYEARVDGYLCSRDNEVKAIVEVKPFARFRNTRRIKMQEAAQMAAWIGVDPPDIRIMRKEKKTCRYDENTPLTSLCL